MARTVIQDLIHLRKLKRLAVKATFAKSKADKAFKLHQMKTIDRIDAQPADERVDQIGAGGTLFSVVTKVKGHVQDRKRFVRWALQEDDAIQDFLQRWMPEGGEKAFIEDFYDAAMGTALISYKPDTTELNRMANAHVEDGEPLPPGVQWRPDSYISQRKR